MKAWRIGFFFAAASASGFAIVGCGGSQGRPDGGPGAGGGAMVPPDLQAQLDAAKATWAAAKSDCAVYSYERLHDKGIGATGPWTDVEIRNDVPTRRRFSAEVLVDGGFFAWMRLWDEMGNQVGEHTGDPGVFPPPRWNSCWPSARPSWRAIRRRTC